MNPRLEDNELFALLDDAANEITPVPDLGRLDAALRGPRRTRPVVYGVTAAAAVAAPIHRCPATTMATARIRWAP